MAPSKLVFAHQSSIFNWRHERTILREIHHSIVSTPSSDTEYEINIHDTTRSDVIEEMENTHELEIPITEHSPSSFTQSDTRGRHSSLMPERKVSKSLTELSCNLANVKRYISKSPTIYNVKAQAWYERRVTRVFLLLTLVYLYHLFLAYLFILYESDETERQIQLRESNRQELKTRLQQEYDMTEEKFLSLEGEFQRIFDLPMSNPWSQFLDVFIFAVTIGSTLGYGVFTPSTDSGKLLTVFGGLLGVVFCLGLFVEFYQMQMSMFRIAVRWVDKHYWDLSVNIHNRWFDFLHALLIVFYIALFSLIISSLPGGHPEWSKIEAMYAYFQLWTTIGFGDVPFYESNSNSIAFYFVVPILLYGWALFPVLIVAMFNAFKDSLLQCLRPCCSKDVYKKIKRITEVSGGALNENVYEAYRRNLLNIQIQKRVDEKVEHKFRQSVAFQGSAPVLPHGGYCPFSLSKMGSNPCLSTPRHCIRQQYFESMESVWTTDGDDLFSKPSARLLRSPGASIELGQLNTQSCNITAESPIIVVSPSVSNVSHDPDLAAYFLTYCTAVSVTPSLKKLKKSIPTSSGSNVSLDSELANTLSAVSLTDEHSTNAGVTDDALHHAAGSPSFPSDDNSNSDLLSACFMTDEFSDILAAHQSENNLSPIRGRKRTKAFVKSVSFESSRHL